MQARLLLGMLGKGIDFALINLSTLLSEPYQASTDMLSSIEPNKVTVDPALHSSIQIERVLEERSIELLIAQMHVVKDQLDVASEKLQDLVNEDPRDFWAHLCQFHAIVPLSDLHRFLSAAYSECSECRIMIWSATGLQTEHEESKHNFAESSEDQQERSDCTVCTIA